MLLGQNFLANICMQLTAHRNTIVTSRTISYTKTKLYILNGGYRQTYTLDVGSKCCTTYMSVRIIMMQERYLKIIFS